MFNVNLPDSGNSNSKPQQDDSPKSSNSGNSGKSDDSPKSSNSGNSGKSGNSHAGEPCGSNGGNTKDWYCHGTHHHCAKGQDNCEFEGGRA